MIKRAVLIALVVGTLLNIINQYDAIFGGVAIQWLKAVLTYCVPFGVSLVSSVITMRDIAQEQKNSG
ncbi:nitrate/nitrite transporter NrtS [Vibrio kyushuensis]|uniref:nitrate/nitrite transporter NrtS n=1 Tax=Vibrio kyushuensis TaxID=2910249 RepID=UPI003D0A7F3F